MAKKLPLGTQNFEDSRRSNLLYIDKSQLLIDMVAMGKTVFLSRPRRFGKSLLCSTLKSFWEGKRELFTGLAIDSSDWNWEPHPVIHLDFNGGNFTLGTYELKANIAGTIENVATEYGVSLPIDFEALGQTLFQLIRALHLKTGKQAVVIIDEYDKPLLTTIDNDATHAEHKAFLKGFYGVLKSADEHLAFLFLTGVTKFSQVSIFSDLNHLQDISLSPRFATLCGFTHDEVVLNFQEEITHISTLMKLSPELYLEKLRRFYNGYRFSRAEQSVYNPFGLLNHFTNELFEPYWFASGTPTFLLKLIEEQQIDILRLEGMEAVATDFADYRKDALLAVPVLYQAGYLTISGYDESLNSYTLDYPNDEVRSSFAKSLADKYAYAPEFGRESLVLTLTRALRKGDVDGCMNALIPFFAEIPYDLNDKSERHYQIVFYLIFRLLGHYCITEVKSAKGRADAIVEAGEFVYCFEFKLFDTAENALAQIEDRGYLTPYTGSGKKLLKVGVAFDATERNIGEWKVELAQ